MATTTTGSTDWEELAEQGLGLLKALAATVTPTPEAEGVVTYYGALIGALGRPSRTLRITVNSPTNLTIENPPDRASSYRVGNFGLGGVRETGLYTSNTFDVKPVDLKQTPVTVELYDSDKILLARGVII